MLFIVGPCSLESKEQIVPIVELCKRLKITYFRAQLFKPRTFPDSFQGLGVKGLPLIEYLLENGLKLVTEACSLEQLEIVKDFASVVQIGTRNMQNFELLKGVGPMLAHHPDTLVMLKRGFSNTLPEWLASARYLEKSGVPPENIVLCERGSRCAFAPTGVVLDFAMALKAKQHGYKVIIDPSHGTKDAPMVLPLLSASLSLPLDGAMVEIHPRPRESWSDAAQAVSLEDFENFFSKGPCLTELRL